MDFRPPFIADTQPTELVVLGYRTLNYPAVDTQPAAMAGQILPRKDQNRLNSEERQHSPMSF